MRREELAQMEHNTAATEERQLREQIARLREQQQAQLRTLSERARAGEISPVQQAQAMQYVDRIGGSIDTQLDVMAQVQVQVLETREALIEVLREKKTLEQLKQNQLAAEASERARREANTADEMTMARFARQAKEA